MPNSLRAWRRGALLLLALMTGGAAAAQETPDLAKDTIFARKILMTGIAANIDEITKMLDSKAPLDLEDARYHADMISIMLLSFPHLFPSTTNQWKAGVERDPGTDTFAAPEIWTHYQDFYARAGEASKIAYRASRADKEPAFRGAVAELEAACNDCHALYQKRDNP